MIFYSSVSQKPDVAVTKTDEIRGNPNKASRSIMFSKGYNQTKSSKFRKITKTEALKTPLLRYPYP